MSASSAGTFDAAELRRAREAAGLSRAQLATRVKTDAEVVSLWEERGVTPTPARIKQIAEAIGITVDDLYRPSAQASPLIAMRTRAGLSQRALAQKIGVSQALVSRIERGQADLTPELSESLAEALGVPIGEVIAAVESTNYSASAASSVNGPSNIKPVNASHNSAGRVAHIVLAYRMEYQDDVLVKSSTQPVQVDSPQGFRIEGGEDVDTETLVGLTLWQLSGGQGGSSSLPYSAIMLHHEMRVIMDGEPVYALRQQMVPDSEGRKPVFNALASLLTPQWPSPTTGANDPAVKATLRRELFGFMPDIEEGVGRRLIAAGRRRDHTGF
ncbi:helix-turn-helix domain-containing protein, partial [Mycobacteroides abscessus subsp. massiliense]|nr:helix-turn-helix domain-containing protein [Mycobacteroides abscessus subsp. massiliense]